MGERTGAATQGGGRPRMREAVADSLWLARLPWRVLGSGGGLLLANRQVERSRTAHAARAGRSMLGAKVTRRPNRALRSAGSSRAAGHGHESTPANRSRRHLLRSRRRHLGPLRHLPRSARLARDVRTGSRADGQMRLHRPADRARQGNRHRMRMCSWCKERRSGRDGLSSGSSTTDRPHVGCREHVSQGHRSRIRCFGG